VGNVICPVCNQMFSSQIEYSLHFSHKHYGPALGPLTQQAPEETKVEEVAEVEKVEEPKADDEAPNYKDSQKIIGQLYPVLKSKDGQVIDGFHRLAVDPNWKSLVLPEVDTEEKLLIARAVSNWHRRKVGEKEKAEWINGLAEIYQKQGLQVAYAIHTGFENQIKNRIVEVTGLDGSTVNTYLSHEFKQELKGGTPKGYEYVPASQRTETRLGEKIAERFRKQVLEEEKLSPEDLAKLKVEQQHNKEERERKAQEKKLKKEEQKAKKEEERKQLEEKIRKEVVKRDFAEVKQELLKDPSFQREVLQEADKAQIEESTEASVEIENNPTNTKTQQIVKEMIEEYLPAIKEAYKKIKPEKNHEPERNKLVLNMLLKNLEQGLIFCPICDQQMLECSHCHTSLSKMKEDTRI